MRPAWTPRQDRDHDRGDDDKQQHRKPDTPPL
jgi:hypothetical protein